MDYKKDLEESMFANIPTDREGLKNYISALDEILKWSEDRLVRMKDEVDHLESYIKGARKRLNKAIDNEMNLNM